MRSWIVRFWDRLFAALRWVSLYNVLRRVVRPLRSEGGVEAWVSAHLLLALAGAVLASRWPTAWVTRVLVVYGLLRVFEITVYQVNVLLFDQLRAHRKGMDYALTGYARIVILLVENYFEIIFWFAAAYGLLVPEVGPVARTLPVLLKESFATFTGFGPSCLAPSTDGALALVWAESAVGLFMSVVMLARFIGILPRPRSATPGESGD